MAPKGSGPSTRETWTTALTAVEANQVLVRGYPIDELMGRVSFADALYLLLTGELPSPSISRLVNAMLTGFIDHGVLAPPTLAARYSSSTGATLQGAVAAGILSFGPHYGGAARCRTLLEEGLDLAGSSLLLATAATEMVEQLVQTDQIPPPGFGQQVHTTDPRVTRLLQMALELEVDALYTQYLRALEQALSRHPALEDQLLPINIDGAIAAVCGDLGLAPGIAEALLIISRVPGLVAHALEEHERHEPVRLIDPEAHRYDGPAERRLRNHR
ncbi:MAG: citrate/2-methylcitrate synthase [Vicinamibacterales bacterium]